MADMPPSEPAPEPQADEAPPVFKAIVITDIGERKIAAIKLLRTVTPLELVEAKKLAERPTPFILAACDEDSAKQFQAIAAEYGVTCELQAYDDSMQPAIANDKPFDLTRTAKGGCGTAIIVLVVGAGSLGYLVVSLVDALV